MKALLTDPVVLICSGIIVVGIIGFFWATGKFRRLGAESSQSDGTDDLLMPSTDLPEISIQSPFPNARMPAPSAPSTSGSGPVVSKDVADRLESMTQRLSEMQSVLMKQSAAGTGAAGAPAGGVGQGFSPETIDKLLKIIGNVIQQVDILQKSLNTK
jgi:hypothetical protein